jgi:hypothetical protein
MRNYIRALPGAAIKTDGLRLACVAIVVPPRLGTVSYGGNYETPVEVEEAMVALIAPSQRLINIVPSRDLVTEVGSGYFPWDPTNPWDDVDPYEDNEYRCIRESLGCVGVTVSDRPLPGMVG